MATKQRPTDPLEDAKIDRNNEPVDNRNPKAIAAAIVAAARKALPNGVPEGSPFLSMTHDGMLQEANRTNLAASAIFTELELRLVLEHRRHTTMQLPHTGVPVGSKLEDPPTPVPEPPPKRTTAPAPVTKATEPEPNATRWRVKNEPKRSFSFEGQMFQLHQGAIIELRHYGAAGIAAIRAQGAELEAYPYTE